MDLKAYLFTLSVQHRHDFAERCGTSYPHLRNIAYGLKPCGEGLAVNVDRESGGAVRCESLRPDVDWAYLRGTARRVRQKADDEDRQAKAEAAASQERATDEAVRAALERLRAAMTVAPSDPHQQRNEADDA